MAGVTAKELAAAWGMTFQRVYQLVDEKVIPAPVDGRFDPKEATRIYVTHLRSLLQGNSTRNLTEQRERLTRLKADQEEIELKKCKGELLNTDAAMRLWGEVIRTIRGQLLSLPGKTASVLVGIKKTQEARDILEREINGICNELANPDLHMAARMAGDKRRASNLQAAAKVKGKRVVKRKKIPKSGE